MVDISRSAHGPVVLLIHVGGNDICTVHLDVLLTIMKADVERIPFFFVFDKGRGTREQLSGPTGQLVSGCPRLFVPWGGVVFRNHQLEGDNRRLMTDGVHLNLLSKAQFCCPRLQCGEDGAQYFN